ncbi:phage major tail tube protein [Vibrio parahaemolyticus]|uniref:Phage major tail tube protein n=5 Tax=Vibrio harveyi group TaxID=717610 RepID=A0AAP9GII5_9VIBR|nr:MULTISPECIES: phage major tail tube protein [Vibrio harveyi group]EJL3960650.1 phage major tail tube protein [Vibrio parahaemolyticus]MBE3815342.1 hypothetical protein [Vibrio parahaemolyticus]MBE3825800.1 hypothetical protein [Vibrio parahaemolyticus]MBE3880666.1 hypothetical protein [Vibrio parahaemolyticus]MBE3912352.1 hypothetical protein [Vibrio parahaemolyticus]
MAENHVTKRNHMCFINETQYIGRVKAITAEPQLKVETFSALGGIGDMEIPNGDYEAMAANIEFDSTAPADLKQLTKNGGYVAIRALCDVRGLDVTTGTRRLDGVVTRIWGYVKNPPATHHTKEKVAYTAQMSVFRIEISNNSGRLFELDFVTGVRYPADEPGSGGITISL